MRDNRRRRRWPVFLSVAIGLTAGLLWVLWPSGPSLVSQASASTGAPGDRTSAPQEGVRHTISVTARRYEFAPNRIEVRENDLVRITFSTEDIPHSFVIDEYRIAKRAAPGKPVTFEFRADRVGSFPYICNLTLDNGCRRMSGELVVTPR